MNKVIEYADLDPNYFFRKMDSLTSMILADGTLGSKYIWLTIHPYYKNADEQVFIRFESAEKGAEIFKEWTKVWLDYTERTHLNNGDIGKIAMDNLKRMTYAKTVQQ